MKAIHLDKEEKELSDSYDRGEWRSVKNIEREKQKLRDAGKNTLKKDARINIRLSSKDLGDIQAIAVREGIPYQTLFSSVIHKYASGLLTEKRGLTPIVSCETHESVDSHERPRSNCERRGDPPRRDGG